MKKLIHHQKGGSKFTSYINTQQRRVLKLKTNILFCDNVLRNAFNTEEKNLRDTRVKVVFPFPKSGLLCKEIITLRLLPHVIKGHTFAYRPSSHLKDLIQQTWNNHYYHHLRISITVQKWETNQIVIVLITLQNIFIFYWPLKIKFDLSRHDTRFEMNFISALSNKQSHDNTHIITVIMNDNMFYINILWWKAVEVHEFCLLQHLSHLVGLY